MEDRVYRGSPISKKKAIHRRLSPSVMLKGRKWGRVSQGPLKQGVYQLYEKNKGKLREKKLLSCGGDAGEGSVP